MSSRPVPLRQAAAELGLSAATLRRWLQQGAPVVRSGSVGRAHGALVVVAQLQRWRASEGARTADTGVSLDDLKRFLEDYHRAGDHRLVGLDDVKAKALYDAMLEYVVGRLGP